MDKKEIEYTGSLLKFHIDEHKMEDFVHYVGAKIAGIEELLEVNTDGVEPTVRLSRVNNVFREDVVRPSYPTEKLLSNAAEHDASTYIVPKIVE